LSFLQTELHAIEKDPMVMVMAMMRMNRELIDEDILSFIGEDISSREEE
jgi:hypothetical protein